MTGGAAVTSSGTPHLSPKIPVPPKQRSKETSPRGDVEAGTRLASTAGPPDSKWNKAGQFFEHSKARSYCEVYSLPELKQALVLIVLILLKKWVLKVRVFKK